MLNKHVTIVSAISILLGCCHPISAQEIVETIYKINKVYSPVFSKNESGIELRLLKGFTIGSMDTSYTFNIRVLTKNAETIGGTSSFAISGFAWAAGASESYRINKEDEYTSLTPTELAQLKDGINSVYLHIKQAASEQICTIRVSSLTLGAELVPGDPIFYFFAIGKAVFRMTEEDFIDLIKVIVKANSLINNRS